MKRFLHSVLVLFKKEVQIILRDPRSRVILVAPVIIQSFLFGYVATFDLNRVDYALLDQDRSYSSGNLVAGFNGSKVFKCVETLDNETQIRDVLDRKRAVLVLHIGPSFEKELNSGNEAPVQILVDGRNGNVAGIAAGYAATIINEFNQKTGTEREGGGTALNIATRAWYNPNLETRWNLVSGLVVILATVQVMLLTSLSVSREKEQGTFDQLLVTPFNSTVILLGKALPPAFVGLVQSSLVLAIAVYWFKIPFSGSFQDLFVGLGIFNFALVGLGLTISALTSTMQQSMLYSFSFIITMMLLSGFISPISSMPEWLQTLTLVNPVRYGVEFAQRIYLEGISLRHIFIGTCLPPMIISMFTLTAAGYFFRSHLK